MSEAAPSTSQSAAEASTSQSQAEASTSQTEALCSGCEITMIEFFRMSDDNDKLLEFLYCHGLLKRDMPCPKCGQKCVISKDFLEYRCSNIDRVSAKKNKKKAVQCNVRKSMRTGTWFENSKLTLEKACRITTLWLFIHSPKQNFIAAEAKCSPNTVVDWSNYCREVCLEWAEKNSQKIGGEDVVVEIDEAKIGKRKYNRGRIIEGKWIFGGIERGTKRHFVVPVPERSSATLLSVINEWIEPGTTIMSDCWKAYDCLGQEGYIHQTVNHSKNFVDPETGAHTQNVERMWRDLKGSLPRYGTVDKHLAGYLAEFMFRRAHPDHNCLLHNFYTEIATVYKGT